MKRVLIVQRVLPHYRVPFFENLRESLAEDGVRLELAVGLPTKTDAAKRDDAHLGWAHEVHNRYIKVGRGKHVVWQPIWTFAKEAELVVVEQASRLLVNYLLLIRRRLGGPKVAFWGHGENLDRASASRIGEAVKRRMAPRADWWFCYTAGTARLLASAGVRREQMTVVQNAVDVRSLRALLGAVTDSERRSLRASLGIGDGPVALSLGSIYPSKRPRYLVESADQIQRMLPGFHLVIVGDGPDRAIIDTAAVTRPWLHPVGMRTGAELVRYASIASILLNPGLVGLAVLDAFALELPMITCDLDLHSPEIEYLTDGVNGLVLPSDATPEQFAIEAARVSVDADLLRRLREGCVTAASTYSIEAMVQNFRAGVVAVLSAPR